MAAMSRLKWLVLPLVVAISWRIALAVYWHRDREDWIRKNGGDSVAAAFGDGKLDAQALLLTRSSLLLAIALCLLLPAPKAWRVFVIGAFAVLFAMGIDLIAGELIDKHLGARVRFDGPTVVGALLALTAFWWIDCSQKRQTRYGA